MSRIDCKIRFGCNNFCKFCVQGDKRDRFADKPLEKIKAELAEGLLTGAKAVVLTGGEPLLHKNILEIISSARSLGYNHVQLQTNGRLFCYMDFCKAVLKAGATEFSPALHGSTAEIHDFLTDAPGSYAQTVKGIMNLRSLGCSVVTNSVITSRNMKDLPALARLFVRLGVEHFQFAFVHILGHAADNKKWIVPRKSELAPYLKKAIDVGLKAGVTVVTEAVPYCFLKGYEDHIAEAYIPETTIFDANFKVDKFSVYRRSEGKARGPKCSKCKYFAVCEGPWREYPELFGWEEFKPVR